MLDLTRRTVLATAAAGAAWAAITPVSRAENTDTSASGSDPFQLGVASGDPAADGFVIWTRLATDPLSSDGLGGLGDKQTTVQWQVATDEKFTKVVANGTVQTNHLVGHSVHVEVTNLEPNQWFYYRFQALGSVSQVGRARTAPAAGGFDQAKIAVASCAQWEHGWFTGYRDMANQNPDLVVHLGDYIYEHGPLMYPVLSGRVRGMVGGETFDLADYRRRYALYRTDADLQAAHRAAPWVTVFDDHEVDNDWAGDYHEFWGKTEAFIQRRAAAFQAFYENMPLRASQKPQGPHLELHRRIKWGSLFALNMVDTRQYRDTHVCRWTGPCEEAKDPARTMLGARQEAWLKSGYASSPAVWQIMGNQVMFAPYDEDKGSGVHHNMDGWDGYVAARSRVVSDWKAAGVQNPVVLTGDYHQAFAFDVPDVVSGGDSVGVEIVTSSISSGGLGEDAVKDSDSQNPHLRLHQKQRGYVMMQVSQQAMDVTWRSVAKVNDPKSAIVDAAVRRVVAGSRRFS